ncbi:hypothetical protein MGN70_005618 [Eutypa lata]|nr:hypothetical protein MGN70_005618 [Eutypa lata]
MISSSRYKHALGPTSPIISHLSRRIPFLTESSKKSIIIATTTIDTLLDDIFGKSSIEIVIMAPNPSDTASCSASIDTDSIQYRLLQRSMGDQGHQDLSKLRIEKMMKQTKAYDQKYETPSKVQGSQKNDRAGGKINGGK